ncbi:MFS transporter [Falcatimonas sp. MSJ-15]|uniref:MFS transporter n=1 Tax=Falcatimonas sp. MSJ-15 TaxID=2841515 RepID=UPI001C110E6A|nr:MFS transporter [Falcatimonas sp. MSJ-15]MBU5469268.1 MFS transporter [Falcatimonas sp. MSJ-15]
MNRNKILLILAIAINNIGDVIFDMFITWKLAATTGRFMNAVYVIGTSIAFRAILSFFIGSFVDKHIKKKMMVLSHVLSIVIITCFGVCWNIACEFIIVGIVFVLLNDINNELFSRSYISMTSDMFDENQYIKFQSYTNIVIRIVGIAGAAFVGILIDHIPGNLVFGIDIVTYLISLVLICAIQYDEKVVNNTKNVGIVKNIILDVKYTLNNIFKSKYLLTFIVLMFVLNLAYGYIPQILPVFKANMVNSATLLGLLKSAMTIGEIIGLAVVSRVSKYVSATFKISMILNIFIIVIIYITRNPYLLITLFTLYGFSDSLTQPLFGYTVANLDSDNRGKLLGGIDAIIMFSPSIGIYIISAVSNYSQIAGGILLSAIFLAGFLIIILNDELRNIKLEK